MYTHTHTHTHTSSHSLPLWCVGYWIDFLVLCSRTLLSSLCIVAYVCQPQPPAPSLGGDRFEEIDASFLSLNLPTRRYNSVAEIQFNNSVYNICPKFSLLVMDKLIFMILPTLLGLEALEFHLDWRKHFNRGQVSAWLGAEAVGSHDLGVSLKIVSVFISLRQLSCHNPGCFRGLMKRMQTAVSVVYL